MKTSDILIRPVITEKSTLLKEKSGELCFQVARAANKHEIQHAIEKAFGVQVESVRTVKVWGKFKRQGKTAGYRSDRKKAYVTLKAGSKTIEYFEL